ncbi:MAG: hypothetical protein PHF46_01800 [Candidatus Gracilibacteria bacterium]|nr:hypothetical protein [Candidatus Gracilibacteria bacterium]MDD4530632.1 hypothetical protein [Candidatus Gracilibacteria bacterium]
MSNIFKIVDFFKKRPSDKKIMIFRTGMGLVLLALLLLCFTNNYQITFFGLEKQYEIQLKGALLILPLIPIILGVFAKKICIAKTKYMRIGQIFIGFLLIFIGSNLNPQIETKIEQTGSIDLTTIQTNKQVSSINYGFLIALIGIFPILAGVSGKCITNNCLKHKEKITKIRV